MSSFEENKIIGIHYETNEPIQVKWKRNKVIEVKVIESDQENLPTIAPGFVDLQVNGYKGIDFNYKPITAKDWESVIYALAEVGVTEFYPTFITNSFERLKTNFEASEKVLKQLEKHAAFIGGYHLEGPYLSKEDGPRGAHSTQFVKAPDWDEFSRLQEAANGRIKLLTLSPEWEGSDEFIRKAVDAGVKIAIGHTAAETIQIEKAVAAGATLSTHLGNGAHIQLPRHPNYLWDQLSHDELFATVIADGHHLPKSVLNVFNKVKREKMLIISDSVALAGMPAGDYLAPVGGEVTLTKEGRLHLKNEERLLAGSAQNIWQGVQYLVKENICSFSEAINKASVLPSNFMNKNINNRLTAGAQASFIVINKERNTIEKTIKDGTIFYEVGEDK